VDFLTTEARRRKSLKLNEKRRYYSRRAYQTLIGAHAAPAALYLDASTIPARAVAVEYQNSSVRAPQYMAFPHVVRLANTA
jgi:hypothetical protein